MGKLYVLQRTPSSVDVRANSRIDPAEFAEVRSEPGWQLRWMENFCKVNTGRAGPDEKDLVSDGWTDLSKRILTAMSGIPPDQRTPEKMWEAFESADDEKMNEIRARTDQVVQDPQTADKLKAWYR